MRTAYALALLLAAAPFAPAVADGLGSPADCTPGETCFVQQFPDMDPGPGAVDPFCGHAVNDGHDGTDLRVMSMADVARGVPVTAVGDGTVLRTRDGVHDRPMASPADRAAVAGMECGNGLVEALGDGLEVQYCHMRKDSVAVRSGDRVAKGQTLGMIGASGMAEFPHVHITVRRNGKPIDPSTGRFLTEGCAESDAAAHPLFDETVAEAFGRGQSQFMAIGLSGAPLDYPSLVVKGPPPTADRASTALVAWAWMINLDEGDRIRIAIAAPDGRTLVDNEDAPLDHDKAVYASFAGLRFTPPAGTYGVAVGVVRDGRLVLERKANFTVR